jgi:aspartate-semialdehyde dehydrogenase
MLNETRKIFGDDQIRLSATCVRVPVFHGHSEAVWIETGRRLDPGAARELMRRAPGIMVLDEPEAGLYPMPIDAVGRDEVFVGRVRADLSHENGLAMWIVADNLRKGAAANAVEIAELLIRDPELLKTSWEW